MSGPFSVKSVEPADLVRFLKLCTWLTKIVIIIIFFFNETDEVILSGINFRIIYQLVSSFSCPGAYVQLHAQCDGGSGSVVLRLHHRRRRHHRLPSSGDALPEVLRPPPRTGRLSLRQPQHYQHGRFRGCLVRSLSVVPLSALHLRGRRHQRTCPGPGRWELPQRRVLLAGLHRLRDVI